MWLEFNHTNRLFEYIIVTDVMHISWEIRITLRCISVDPIDKSKLPQLSALYNKQLTRRIMSIFCGKMYLENDKR